MKEFRNPTDVFPPQAGYVHQIEVSRGERLLVLSGQIGCYEDGTVPEDSIEQLGVACENLHRNLRLAGMDMIDLIKLTFYIVGEMDAAERGKVLGYRLGNH